MTQRQFGGEPYTVWCYQLFLTCKGLNDTIWLRIYIFAEWSQEKVLKKYFGLPKQNSSIAITLSVKSILKKTYGSD